MTSRVSIHRNDAVSQWEQIPDPLTIIKHYQLSFLSAKLGELIGTLRIYRTFGVEGPEWLSEEMRRVLDLRTCGDAHEVIEKAYKEYTDYIRLYSRN